MTHNATVVKWGAGVLGALIIIAVPFFANLWAASAAQEKIDEHVEVPHPVTKDMLNDRKFATAAVNGRVDLLEQELGHIKKGVDDNSGKLDAILRKINE